MAFRRRTTPLVNATDLPDGQISLIDWTAFRVLARPKTRRNRVRQKADFAWPFKLIWLVQPSVRKYICL
jgi:hypothetical protein